MKRRIVTGMLCVLACAGRAGAASCEGLATLQLPHTTITLADIVNVGTFTQLPLNRLPGYSVVRLPTLGFADLPAFCRVLATLMPSSDSDIKMELWMPVSGWNGNLWGNGNDFLGGGTFVNPERLARALRRGYATAGTNTGHEDDSRYAMNHPEQVKDFGWRAAHEMTVAAKALIQAFYGSEPAVSYMAELGGGTIAALSAAQRFPNDYDMIAVVGMSSYLSRHTAAQFWTWYATHKDEASYLPSDKLAVLHQAALNACDALDGLKDGVIGLVERCKFDPGVTLCQGVSTSNCLTAPQVEAARKIYAGPTNPRTKERIFWPLHPGSELNWGLIAGGAEPFFIQLEFYKYYVFKDPRWDYRSRPVNFDRDIGLADRVTDVNAVNPDLRRFFARGGKLLLIEGWSDASVPPKVALDYYQKVVAMVGTRPVKESMRFFMVPGMEHGPGTTGPDNYNFDSLSLLEKWQRTGNPPDQLIVDHYRDGTEVGKRLVCQYPKLATHQGRGSTEDPASYRCR